MIIVAAAAGHYGGRAARFERADWGREGAGVAVVGHGWACGHWWGVGGVVVVVVGS